MFCQATWLVWRGTRSVHRERWDVGTRHRPRRHQPARLVLVRRVAERPRQARDLECVGFWLSHVREARLADFLALLRRWLKPTGSFAFIDEQPQPTHTPTAGELQPRELADGREFTIIKVYRAADMLAGALRAAGFVDVDVRTTSRHFVMGHARAP